MWVAVNDTSYCSSIAVIDGVMAAGLRNFDAGPVVAFLRVHDQTLGEQHMTMIV